MRRYLVLSVAWILLVSLTVNDHFDSLIAAQAPPVTIKSEVATVDSYVDKWGVVPMVNEPPVIDGVLDENMWRQTAQLGNFRTAFYDAAILSINFLHS